jgi:CMP-N-acetylneuraminic acid synthetase
MALLEVEAWVVDVRDAAGADDAGILNPMLHRFKVTAACSSCQCCVQPTSPLLTVPGP